MAEENHLMSAIFHFSVSSTVIGKLTSRVIVKARGDLICDHNLRVQCRKNLFSTFQSASTWSEFLDPQYRSNLQIECLGVVLEKCGFAVEDICAMRVMALKFLKEIACEGLKRTLAHLQQYNQPASPPKALTLRKGDAAESTIKRRAACEMSTSSRLSKAESSAALVSVTMTCTL